MNQPTRCLSCAAERWPGHPRRLVAWGRCAEHLHRLQVSLVLDRLVRRGEVVRERGSDGRTRFRSVEAAT